MQTYPCRLILLELTGTASSCLCACKPKLKLGCVYLVTIEHYKQLQNDVYSLAADLADMQQPVCTTVAKLDEGSKGTNAIYHTDHNISRFEVELNLIFSLQ